jgi:hypothetical protein
MKVDNSVTERKTEETLYKEAFKKRLYFLIEYKANGSNQQFAAKIGYPLSSVNNWTKLNNSVPTAKIIKDICQKCDISCDWLVCDQGYIDNYSLSKWDYRIIEWINLWNLNPEFCDSEMFNFYNEAYEAKIKTKLNKTKKTKEKNLINAIKLIKADQEKWCKYLENYLKNLRLAENTRKRIYEEVDGLPIRKTEKENGKRVPLELTEEESKIIKLAHSEVSNFRDGMRECEKSIESLLRLFEED